jgi:hypothetical protein
VRAEPEQTIDYALHKVDDTIACLQRLEKTSTLVISVISQMELIVGCRN